MNKKTALAVSFFAVLAATTVAMAVTEARFPTSLDRATSIAPVLSTNDSSSEVYFGDFIPGMTQYSQNELVVCNAASVPQKFYIAGTDYEVDNGVCPSSNMMAIERVDYYFGGSWKNLQEYRSNYPCSGSRCRTFMSNELKTFAPGECVNIRFRRNIPSPCSGVLDGGGEIVVLADN